MTVEESDRELLRRCDEFMLALDRESLDRIEPVDGGFAALTPSLPRVWSANYLMFERPGMDAERMAAICEQVLSDLGMDHREICVMAPEEGVRLEPDFKRMGWEVDRDLFMVLRSDPDDRGKADGAVRRVTHPEDLRRALLNEDEYLRAEGEEELPEAVEQLLEIERRLNPFAGDRWFVADADGAPASAARLLARDGIGQVEDVATLASARNRGLARATVLAAIEASREDGNELTFIVARADDWPKDLYQRLGFEPIGTLFSFRRPGSFYWP